MRDSRSPSERLYAIAEQGICIGCGLCQSIAGPEVLKVRKSANGYERPIVAGKLDHATVDQIYDTCPGTRIEGLPERLIAPDTKIDNVWGPWRRAVRAWATDPEIRFEGSTGGVLTALGIYLLESGRVDFILHAKAGTHEPTFGERHLSFTREDVIAAAGSRYGPTAVLLDIGDILDRGQPFAFVGKPCDIAALRNYARHDARVDELVKYWLTPVCGGFVTPDSMAAFLGERNIAHKDVAHFRYRGRGCPGPTRVETKDGAVSEAHYLDIWGESGKWTLPFRCNICPDGIGEAADLAASDTWINSSPTREGSKTDPGTNALIARTTAGQELMEAAQREGVLTFEYDVTPDELSVYQRHQMKKKYVAWPRLQGLGDGGHIVPETARLRIEELAAELPDADNERQRVGAKQRVERGRASEPTPREPS